LAGQPESARSPELALVGDRESKGLLGFALSPFETVFRHRRLLFRTAAADMRARYAGSVLGLAWMFVYPVLFLGIYSLVYIVVFKVRLQLYDSNEYVLMIFCGLIPFLGFTEGLGLGVPSISSNASLIRNTLYPVEMVPTKAIVVSQCNQVVGLLLLLVATGFAGRLAPSALALLAIWPLQICFTLGVVWVLATLNIYFRDLQASLSLITLLLLVASPIAYTEEMVGEGAVALLRLNPLYYFIVGYRAVLFEGRLPDVDIMVAIVVLGLGSLWGGFWFVSQAKAVFSDNV